MTGQVSIEPAYNPARLCARCACNNVARVRRFKGRLHLFPTATPSEQRREDEQAYFGAVARRSAVHRHCPPALVCNAVIPRAAQLEARRNRASCRQNAGATRYGPISFDGGAIIVTVCMSRAICAVLMEQIQPTSCLMMMVTLFLFTEHSLGASPKAECGQHRVLKEGRLRNRVGCDHIVPGQPATGRHPMCIAQYRS